MTFLKINDNDQDCIGAISSSSPEATCAGKDMLSIGGNAADAATACAFSLMVTDPANASPAGRCQIIFGSRSSPPSAIDGTTVAPSVFRRHESHEPIPIPGAVSALISFHKSHGKLPLGEVIGPALKFARNGFEIGKEQAKIWSWREPEIKGTNLESLFLPRGMAPQVGEIFCNSNLVGFFDLLKKTERDPFRNSDFVAPLLDRMRNKGLAWGFSETLLDRTCVGQVIWRDFDNFRVWTVGKQGWGHAMIDMLDKYFRCSWPDKPPKDLKLAISIVLGVLSRLEASQKQIEEAYWSDIESGKMSELEITNDLLNELVKVCRLGAEELSQLEQDRDTTALAVCDKNGNFVSITQSIGPHFGSRILDEETGIVFAHSYQMDANFAPSGRDITELCPSICKIDQRMFALGAAGSERIPGAVAAVICHLTEGKSLEDAVNAPRVNYTKSLLRVHDELRPVFSKSFEKMNLKIEFSDRGPIDHLGIVHAVGNSTAGAFEAAADPAYSGLGQIIE